MLRQITMISPWWQKSQGGSGLLEKQIRKYYLKSMSPVTVGDMGDWPSPPDSITARAVFFIIIIDGSLLYHKLRYCVVLKRAQQIFRTSMVVQKSVIVGGMIFQ
ncbi:Uncharacterised protein at_DN2219 [Pycnogonum litorale]